MIDKEDVRVLGGALIGIVLLYIVAAWMSGIVGSLNASDACSKYKDRYWSINILTVGATGECKEMKP